MKIVDELMTPACPQCAVKHLSAALYHAAELRRVPHRLEVPDSVVLIARAYINLGEVLIGYKSHLWFAVGLLQRAEERALTEVSSTAAARAARLALEERGANGVRDTMRNLAIDVHLGHTAMCLAHMDEAVRELPAFAGEVRMDDLVGTIERLRKEYFIECVDYWIHKPQKQTRRTRNGYQESCRRQEDGQDQGPCGFRRQGHPRCVQGRQVQGQVLQEVTSCRRGGNPARLHMGRRRLPAALRRE